MGQARGPTAWRRALALGLRGRWSTRALAAAAGATVLLAFAVRSMYAVDLAPQLESQEQQGARMMQRYDEGAASILRGDGLLFVANPDPSDTGLLSRPPGYSLFLALVYRTLGRSFFLVQLVQNALDSLAVSLLFLLACRVVGGPVALAASVLAALAPYLAYYASLLAPDVSCSWAVLGALVLLAPAARRRRMGLGRALAAGLLFGASVWLRPNLLLLGPFVALVLAITCGRRVRAAALVLALGSLAMVAPITLRNYVLYRELVPVSTNFGIVLLEGLGEASGNAWGTRTDDVEVAAQEAEIHGDPRYAEWWASPDGIRRDRDRVRRSLRVIADHPLWFARVVLARMGQMVTYDRVAPEVAAVGLDRTRLDALWEPGQGRTAARLFGERLDALRPVLSGRQSLAPGRWLAGLRPPVRALQRAIVWLARPLALAGVVLLLLLSPRRTAFLIAVPLYQIAFQSIVHFEPRYTLPMQHCLLVFAGVAVVAVVTLAARALSRTMAR